MRSEEIGTAKPLPGSYPRQGIFLVLRVKNGDALASLDFEGVDQRVSVSRLFDGNLRRVECGKRGDQRACNQRSCDEATVPGHFKPPLRSSLLEYSKTNNTCFECMRMLQKEYYAWGFCSSKIPNQATWIRIRIYQPALTARHAVRRQGPVVPGAARRVEARIRTTDCA